METEQAVIGAVIVLILAAVAYSMISGVPILDNPTAKCNLDRGCWIANAYAYPVHSTAVDANGTEIGNLRALKTVCVPDGGKIINNYSKKTILNCTNAVLVQ